MTAYANSWWPAVADVGTLVATLGGLALYVWLKNRRCRERMSRREYRKTKRRWIAAKKSWAYPQVLLNTPELADDLALQDAIALLEEGLFLCSNGERPPGAPADLRKETWSEWGTRVELFLRKRFYPQSSGGAS